MGLELTSYAMMDTGTGGPAIVSGLHKISNVDAGPDWNSLLRLAKELSCRPCTECGIIAFYSWRFNKDGKVGEYLLELVHICLAYPEATLHLLAVESSAV
jgi:hypothetical protein